MLIFLSVSPDISRIAVARPPRWACHLATGGSWFRGVPARYVAGADTRGRQEGWPYPWSQQVIHEISGLKGSNQNEHKKAGVQIGLRLLFFIHKVVGRVSVPAKNMAL